MKQNKIEKAMKNIKLAIKSNKREAFNYYIQGLLYQELQDFDASIKSFKNFLLLNGNSDQIDTVRRAKFNIAICYFTLRNYSKGIKYYRFRHKRHILDLYKDIPLWTPETQKGRVLIWAEQGIGDEIFFFRFLKLLEFFDHEFYLQCDIRLHHVISINYPSINLLDRSEGKPKSNFDYNLPLGDLFTYFYDRMPEIDYPYLRIPIGENIKAISEKYRNKELVGISWRSLNPDYIKQRSVAVDRVCKGLNPDKTALVNLQPSFLDKEIQQLENIGFSVISEFDNKSNIKAVLQLISICKRVVTIDNAVVHFAGALGVDTSLLIIDDLTWRWGTNFKRSDLYPSVEIVRS